MFKMSLEFIFKFITIFACLQNISQAKVTEVIQTKYGPVRGNILTTIINGYKYSAFKGIPYARPPVGEYRFQPPERPASWIDVIYTNKDPSPCPQVDTNLNYVGNEDCLYLNVYSPQLSFEGIQLSAVMVWIYGGAFSEGTNNSTFYGPDFLIEHDVVVVAMNYRLGALGFLSLASETVSGNAGLKDQVFAFEWVKENIERFGGDPNRVTIFGESAGAVSIEFHHLSPLSKGLFRASIAMSGSTLLPWAFNDQKTAVNFSIRAIKTQINNFNPNSTEDIAELFAIPAENLARINFVERTFDHVRFLFAPTNEVPGERHRPFLTKEPLPIYKSGNFIHTPHILGYMKNEIIGLLNAASYYGLPLNKTLEEQLTYLDFIKGINHTRELMVNSSTDPIYYYRNEFYYSEALHNIGLPKPINGSGHADDNAEIFYVQGANQPLDPNTDIGKFRNKLVTMWTNFAKYLNPTALLNDSLTVKWPKSDGKGLLLVLGDTFKVVPESTVDE